MTIALLDTGVDACTRTSAARSPAASTCVGNTARRDRAQPNPQRPDAARAARHRDGRPARRLRGPGGLNGVAPGATMLPIRVAGWQPDARAGAGRSTARTDQLLAGLERAVDPNGDGDAHDAARIALVGVAEPFAAFTDGPLALRRRGGAPRSTRSSSRRPETTARPARRSEASAARAERRAALTVGAADAADPPPGARRGSCVGLRVLFDRRVPLAGAVAPSSDRRFRSSVPRLGPPSSQGAPPSLDAFFDDERATASSRAAPRSSPRAPTRAYAAAQAAKAGAAPCSCSTATRCPAAASASTTASTSRSSGCRPRSAGGSPPSSPGGRPVAAVDRSAALRDERHGGRRRAVLVPRARVRRVVKPDLVAPGVGLADRRPGKAADGAARYSSSQRLERRGGRRRRRGGAARARPGPTSTPRRCKACSSGSARPLPRRVGRGAGHRARSTSARPRRERSRRSRRRSASGAATDARAGTRRAGSSCATCRPGG